MDDTSEDGITRRQFLKTLGWAAVGAAVPVPVEKAYETVANLGGREEAEKEENELVYWKPDEVRVNNIDIQFIGTRHKRGEYLSNVPDLIVDYAQQADHVVLEYFPPEYRDDLTADTLVGRIGRSQYGADWAQLFEDLEPRLAQIGKSVYMLDPAYGEEYMIEVAGLASYSALFGLLIGNSVLAAELVDKIDKEPGLSPYGAAIASVVSFFIRGEKRYTDPGEALSDMFRCACVAQHMIELSKSSSGKFVVVYPTTHLHRIMRLMKDEDLRVKILKAGSAATSVLPHGDDFVKRRHWTPSESGWKKESETPLQVPSEST